MARLLHCENILRALVALLTKKSQAIAIGHVARRGRQIAVGRSVDRLAKLLLLPVDLLLVQAVEEVQNQNLFQREHDNADGLADEDPRLGPGWLIVRDHLRVEDFHENDWLDQVDDENTDNVRDD